jgi:hypothetical protein
MIITKFSILTKVLKEKRKLLKLLKIEEKRIQLLMEIIIFIIKLQKKSKLKTKIGDKRENPVFSCNVSKRTVHR